MAIAVTTDVGTPLWKTAASLSRRLSSSSALLPNAAALDEYLETKAVVGNAVTRDSSDGNTR